MSLTPTTAAPLLQARGLRKSFGAQLVLDGLDLEVDVGDCVVLIGGSGSGKSTLLRCLNLLETVDDGQILLEGTDISDPRADLDAVRSRIGIVFQAFNLFPHLTVLDNITLAPQRVHRVPRAEARAKALEMLDRVGLADKAAVHPDQLSGGQQQRVAIARALVNRPSLLLLDEVTSALDRQVADTVCFLSDGHVLESGPPEEIFTAPRAPRLRSFLAALALHAPLEAGGSPEPDGSPGPDESGGQVAGR
jgi:polar amino acid transport system ATP-binding protein